MFTSVDFYGNAGRLSADTRIWCTNRLFGFTGGVTVLLLDQNHGIIPPPLHEQYGVDSPSVFWKPHDRKIHWEANFDPNAVQSVTSIQIIQYPDPKPRLGEILGEIGDTIR